MRFLLPLLVVGVAQTVWASSAENGATIEERRPLQEGSQGEGLALKKRAQRCALTSACTNTPPANANRLPYRVQDERGWSFLRLDFLRNHLDEQLHLSFGPYDYARSGSRHSDLLGDLGLHQRHPGKREPILQQGLLHFPLPNGLYTQRPRRLLEASHFHEHHSVYSTSSAPSSTSQAPTSTSQAQSTTPAPSTSATTSSTTTSTTTTRPAATAPAATPTLKKTYQGSTFFDSFWFLNTTDPTNGMVSYVGPDYAREHGLINVTEAGTVIISIDRTSKLASGVHRDSVRISSYDTYNAGNLMIFDVKHVPVGCSVWPAIWTFNTPWPDLGEIDIYEGVNARSYNQMTLHSSQGCRRNPATPQTGNPYAPWASDDCYAYGWSSGCTVMDWDPTSYGTGFNAAGGGVWAVLFAETGISMWRWTRSAIPSDIKNGAPGWKQWGTPVAAWDGSTCDIRTYFQWQMITFDITTCGDWAGQQGVWQDQTQSGSCYPKYATCGAAMQDPANFAEAYFEINSVKVYGV
ncbi:hypothetical protein JCM10213v2_004355 [Rhodosporidiobolus nylandii]